MLARQSFWGGVLPHLFLRNLRGALAKQEKLLHNFASVGALAQLVEQRTLNP
jgi:hypothetical protein